MFVFLFYPLWRVVSQKTLLSPDHPLVLNLPIVSDGEVELPPIG